MSKARILANLISDNAELADGQISVAEVVGAAPTANPTFTGTASGTFSGPLTGNVTGNLTGDVTGAVTGDVTAPEIDLTAIAKDISDTAVDVFVYDTSKDSDGGAWRKRTQATSWYNETLNTSTRGSRKEFPAVAVIVAETTQLTIYDGDDPDLPMWMVFTGITNGIPSASSSFPLKDAVFKNGVMAIATSDYGAYTINMISDGGVCYRTQNGYTFAGDFKGTISQRNEAQGFAKNLTSFIVNNSANDVAMTVLPNAPIDSATGLPVPTIAVATDGGVSVIKDDGTVVDIVHSDSAVTRYVWLDGETIAYNVSNFLHARKIPTADVSAGVRYAAHSDDIWFAPRFYYPAVYSLGNFNLHPNSGTVYDVIQKDDYVSVANADKLVLASLSGNQERVANDASYSWITSDYNTGWMNGDIKLATLSDTDDTDVTGTELVTNGTAPISSTTSWNGLFSNTTVSLVSNVIRADANATGAYGVSQAITLDTSKRYTATATVNFDNASGSQGVLRLATAADLQSGDLQIGTTTGTHSITFTPTASTMYFGVADTASSASNYSEISNISIRLAEEDRSVSGKGLQVFGTVTKNPVATGADLVGYSGFSSSNYLEQPYNSDLDYSGDFVVMGWFKGSGSGSVQTVFHRRTANGADNIGLEIGFNTDNTFYFYTHDGSGPTNTALTGNAVSTGVWTHFACVRNGQRMTTYLNGKEYLTATGTVRDITSSTAVCRIGAYVSSSPVYGWQGDIALIRTSATAPSPEQIKKIYEDEKVLFQENAQATLYGSSDAVTALAYDDDTELLHVGTSAGRSVFQGLQRVDNTTDAVGAAISASNGLVAED